MIGFDSGEVEFYSQMFKGLDYSDKEVSNLEFEECTFIECNFSATEFNACKFIDCTFTKCNLSNSNVMYSRFTDVDFDECKVIGIDWTRASWSAVGLVSPLKFNQCILNDSSFFALSLREIVIEGCKAHDVDFREATLSEGSFAYSDLHNSLFHNTKLDDANFTEAIAYDIDIQTNFIKGAKFSIGEAVRLLNGLEIELVY